MNGLGMKLAILPCFRATSLAAYLSRTRIVRGFQRIGVDQVCLDLAGAVLGLNAFETREGAQGLVEIGEQRIQRVGVLQRVGVDVVLER